MKSIASIFIYLFVMSSAFGQISIRNLTQKNVGEGEPTNSSVTATSSYNNGKTLYVSKHRGNNRNDGSAANPYKNLQKAINVAEAGDRILVAEGNYIGLLEVGFVEISKPVKIYGGYSSDFSTRDILKYRSTMICPNEKNGSSSSQATLQLKDNMPQGEIVVDGFIFDNGESNSYKAEEGRPEGCETGRICGIGERGEINNASPSKFNPFIKGVANGNMTVRNCAFLNGTFFGISVSLNDGASMLIENNIFVALQMAAVEVRGNSATKLSDVKVRNNTILFMWPRTKALEDMGYGIRWRSKTNLWVGNNIIGATFFGGLDLGHTVSMRMDEKMWAEHNLFFANKRGDMCLPSGGGEFLQIRAEAFADVEQLSGAEGNVTLTNPEGLKEVIHKPYLNGFLNVAYSESNHLNKESIANQLRSMMGLSLDGGTLQTKVSMFNNRYPREEALRLFGAMKGIGAQLPH